MEKNEAGHLQYRFGPLLQQGGERRLNVAITRARQRLTVVSSFSHFDIDPTIGIRSLLRRHYRQRCERESRGRRCPRRPIDEYSRSELANVARWVESGGRLRTDEEIVQEVVEALGFKRRGTRIVSAIEAAIRQARR